MRRSPSNIWYSLRSSLWFLPTLMLLAAAGAAVFCMRLDRTLSKEQLDGWDVVYTGTADGAREVLGVIAGSMITVAGVVFSITMVVLAQASSQFGPRLLKTFMRDTGNQVVLGTFLSTFLFCILVLRGVRSEEGSVFVPEISVAVALLLALASLCVLIYFIHHVSSSIQAPNVIAVVNEDLKEAISRMFPAGIGWCAAEVEPVSEGVPGEFEMQARPVQASEGGYIRTIDGDRLMRLCRTRDLVIRLLHRPGHFLMQHRDVALVWPGDHVDGDVARSINEAVVLGRYRTLEQDVEFAVDQMVEVAVRALSPAINDPFTAMTCVDRLGDALVRLAENGLPDPLRYDRDGRPRVFASTVTMDGVTDAAFNLIRQNARRDVAVTIRLLDVIGVVAERADAQMRAALLRHAQMTVRNAENFPEGTDRKDIETRYEAVLRAISSGSGGRGRPAAVSPASCT